MGLRTATGVVIAVALLGAASGCGAKPAGSGSRGIVYGVGPEGGSARAGLFFVDDRGGHRRRLTREPPPIASAPQWSPAGDKILFQAVADEIWTIGTDGLGVQMVGHGLDAGWSPDGREIAVVEEKGLVEIVSPDGEHLRTVDLRIGPEELTEMARDWSPDGRRLAVEVESDDGDYERLVLIDADGSARPTPLTLMSGVMDEAPVWSPDGTRIAFLRSASESDSSSAWVIGTDGSGPKLVAAGASRVVWSADGRALLCEIDSPEKNAGIYLFPLNGGPSGRIGPLESGLLESHGRFKSRAGVDVSWEPGGNRVTYIDGEADGELIVSRPDGSDKKVLIDPSQDGVPAWSPDGDRIAFVRGEEQGTVYVVGADGKGEQRIAAGSNPSWSPDGTELLITRPSRRGDVIAAANLASDSVRKIAIGRNPAWSPDGGSIAFVSEGAGKPDGEVDYTAVHSILYVVDRAGTRPQALARAGSGKHPALFDQPVWAPDGKSIFVAESDPFSGGRASVREIRVADGRERVIARDASSNFEYLAVSPGGKQVAFVAGESIDLVELASGERRSVASLRSEFVDGLKWSADGAELAYALSNAKDEVAIDLYVIKTDGSDRRLVSTPGDPVGAFDWRPLANQGRLGGVARNLAG